MNNHNNLELFFSENDFDIHEPTAGHQNRFLEKLQAPKKKKKTLIWWGAVASIALLLGFFGGRFYQNQSYDLRNISAEMAETQDFFVMSINDNLKKINQYRNPQTAKIIDDAVDELNELETQYKKLQKELKITDNQKIIVLNMIQNYQQRIEILQNVLEIIKLQKQLFNPNFNSDEII